MTTPKRILYLQTEDWAFPLHRLPMARVARDAGFEVHVATRIGERRGNIESEGFIVHPISWQRGSRAPTGTLKVVGEIRSVIKSVQPDVLHNVAIKPTLLGSIAGVGIKRLAAVNNISGLGSAFLATAPLKRLLAGTPDPENPTTISETERNRWNSRDGIEWLGHVSGIEDLWRCAHIAVLPSRREGLPKSLLEAAALGRPMIASDAPGCREIAIAGQTALTHPIDDAPAIAEAIKTRSGDGAMRTRFADAVRRLVEERFSDTIIGSQTVALYETMIAAVAEQK